MWPLAVIMGDRAFKKITRVFFLYKKMYVAVLPGRNTEVTVKRDSTVLER